MGGFDQGRRRIFIFLAAIGTFILFLNITLITGTDVKAKIEKIPIHNPLGDKHESADPKPDASLLHCISSILD